MHGEDAAIQEVIVSDAMKIQKVASGASAYRRHFATQRIQFREQFLMALLIGTWLERLDIKGSVRLQFAPMNVVKALETLAVNHRQQFFAALHLVPKRSHIHLPI